jgi:hypothetical protein
MEVGTRAGIPVERVVWILSLPPIMDDQDIGKRLM